MKSGAGSSWTGAWTSRRTVSVAPPGNRGLYFVLICADGIRLIPPQIFPARYARECTPFFGGFGVVDAAAPRKSIGVLILRGYRMKPLVDAYLYAVLCLYARAIFCDVNHGVGKFRNAFRGGVDVSRDSRFRLVSVVERTFHDPRHHRYRFGRAERTVQHGVDAAVRLIREREPRSPTCVEAGALRVPGPPRTGRDSPGVIRPTSPPGSAPVAAPDREGEGRDRIRPN